jgi:hypothetical protein
MQISSRSPSSVSNLIGARKSVAFICFGHYWPSSGGTANTKVMAVPSDDNQKESKLIKVTILLDPMKLVT